MGIIHVRPKWIKNRPSRRLSASAGLRVERNRDGVLYFRQPKGENEFTTWHIYPPGEEMLHHRGIEEGMCLGPGLFMKLKVLGHLYTATGKPVAKSKRAVPPYPAPARGAVPKPAAQSPKRMSQSAAKALLKEEKRARRRAAHDRVAERYRLDGLEERAKRPPIQGKVITVRMAPTERSPRTPSEQQPKQRAFPPAWRGFGPGQPRKTKKNKNQQRAVDQRAHARSAPGGSSNARPRIHPGWLSPASTASASQQRTAAGSAQAAGADASRPDHPRDAAPGSSDE